MSELKLGAVKHDTFSLEPSHHAQCLNVKFTGTGDLNAIDALGQFLPKAHVEGRALGVNEISFDFRDLQFMNSSCFKAFVSFIDNARSSAAGYRIVFVTNPKHHWQRRSLEALRRLALGIVTIRPDT